ncbi:ABC transporter ATP-binding protein [Hirschia maritima]|uniref:ABC transporter ATP-binding protein n=1 Tax=Hirschia maritima TaxID=1121961 RepID=UPI00036C1A81|nr:ABC transporter ATP-binding protein [Hirschia maritima]
MNDQKTLPDFAIELRDLKKTYGAKGKVEEKKALRGVDLKIPRGSIFGLLGPNGAGKSTMINIISGLVNKTSGQVNVWGYDLDKKPREVAAALGVVPQEINMDPFFTPRESMELMAGFYGVPEKERHSDEILEALGLGDKKDAYVRQLSGGMKRRLMVAKAMVHTPPILILDEPTAGVDVELRRQLWEYVKELNAQGTTIVLTTHYLEEAQEMCDQIAIINHGEVIACEETDTLLARLDQKKLIVHPEQSISSLPEELNDLDIEVRNDDALVVTFRANETRVMDLLNRIREAGIRIRDLATEEADLEDVFVSMTSESN